MKSIVLLPLLILALPAGAQIPGQINYQGVLRDQAGVPVDAGTQPFELRLYDASLGDALLYAEQQSTPVVNGLFTVLIGAGTLIDTPLHTNLNEVPFNRPVELGITVGAGTTELTPRVRLTAHPYALNSRGLSLSRGAVAGHVLTSDAVGNGFWSPPVPGPQGPPGADGKDGQDGAPGALAGLSCGPGQVAVFNGTDWICQDFPGYQWSFGKEQTDPFRLEIMPGQATSENVWTGIEEPRLSFVETTGGSIPTQTRIAEWGQLRLTGPVDADSSGNGGLSSRDFEVSGLYGKETVRVSQLKVRFPRFEVSDGRHYQYKVFQPGSPEFDNVIFVGRSGTDESSDVKAWVKSVYEGQDARRDITIHLRRSTNEPPVATFQLFNCEPVSWQPLRHGSGTLERPGLEVVEVRVGRIELSLEQDKIEVQDWYSDMLAGPGSASYRDLRITHLNPDGSDSKSFDFFECFLTSYTLPALDSSAVDEKCVETVEVNVGYSSNYLQ